jgi:hypothetical protein
MYLHLVASFEQHPAHVVVSVAELVQYRIFFMYPAEHADDDVAEHAALAVQQSVAAVAKNTPAFDESLNMLLEQGSAPSPPHLAVSASQHNVAVKVEVSPVPLMEDAPAFNF